MKKIYFLLSTFCFLLIATHGAQAVDFTLPGGIHGPEKGPSGFVDNFYRFSLLIAGVLAFAAIVLGGIKYTFAAGNPSGQSEGKEWVKSALLGLLLLGGAALVLRTINPRLVDLRLQQLSPITASTQTTANPCSGVTECGGGDGTCGGYCPLTADGKTQVCQLIPGEGLKKRCFPSSSGVACGPQADGSNVNGACPVDQSCFDRGDFFNPDWFCAPPPKLTCGGNPPNSKYGTCPPVSSGSPLCGSCVNVGGDTPETARYQCLGSRPCY